jgi:hypothetical protein
MLKEKEEHVAEVSTGRIVQLFYELRTAATRHGAIVALA